MKPILILSENYQVVQSVTDELVKINPEYIKLIVVVKKRNEAITKLRNQKFEAILLDSVDERNYDFLFEFNCPSLILTNPLAKCDVEYFIKLGVKKILYHPATPPQIANHFKKIIKLC